MPVPAIEVLGVYRLAVTPELVREAVAKLAPPGCPPGERAVMEELVGDEMASTVLFEVRIARTGGAPNLGSFKQPDYEIDPEKYQVAYDPVFLSLDGESVVSRGDAPPPEAAEYRCAFWMHFFQPDLALETAYGKVLVPKAKEMPERLRLLVPYRVQAGAVQAG
jgi:hypothetical protein